MRRPINIHYKRMDKLVKCLVLLILISIGWLVVYYIVTSQEYWVMAIPSKGAETNIVIKTKMPLIYYVRIEGPVNRNSGWPKSMELCGELKMYKNNQIILSMNINSLYISRMSWNKQGGKAGGTVAYFRGAPLRSFVLKVKINKVPDSSWWGIGKIIISADSKQEMGFVFSMVLTIVVLTLIWLILLWLCLRRI